MPLLRSMGRGVVDAGPEARHSNVLKLTTNFFIASMIELIAEGMTLADKNGVSRDAVLSVLKESFPGPITTGIPPSLSALVSISPSVMSDSGANGSSKYSSIDHIVQNY